MKNINRRTFLKQSALTAAAVSWSARSWSQVAGSNEDFRMAVIFPHLSVNFNVLAHQRADVADVA